MRPLPLLLAAAASAVLGLEVHEPAYAAGVYAEKRAHFSPQGYMVNGLVTVVKACPCNWTTSMEQGSGSYDGLILAVAEGACSAEAGGHCRLTLTLVLLLEPGACAAEVECTAAEAACAAKQADASGMLLPDGFGDGGGHVGNKVAQPLASWRSRGSSQGWRP